MSNQQKDPPWLECHAARLVAHLTGCAVEQRDFGGGQGSVADFALVAPSGGSNELGLLEVTSVHDDPIREFNAAGTKKLKKGLGSELQYLWMITVPHPKPGQLKTIEAAIVPLLQQAEAIAWVPQAAYLPQLAWRLHDGRAHDIPTGLGETLVRNLLDLHIEWLSAIPAGNQGAVSIQGTRDVYGSDPEVVAKAVVHALGRPDNRHKLMPASADGLRAELFVWLMEGPTTLPIRYPGETGIPAKFPASIPTLPREVTRIWIASGLFNETVPMWSLDESGWRDEGSVAPLACAQHKDCV
jgi:hypothetical protein